MLTRVPFVILGKIRRTRVTDAGDCVFCKIIRGEIPGQIIDQNAQVVALLSLEGHPMVITREHVVDIFAMTDRQAAAVMSEAIKIAAAMRDAIAPDGIHLAQSNGEAAGQEVFHYHMHLYPRWTHGRVPPTDAAGQDHLLQILKAAIVTV
jgi:histidine triad (HIT) family protein